MPGRRLALRAAPAVLAALEALPGALADAAAAIGQPLQLRPDPLRSGPDAWGDTLIEEAGHGG